MPALSRMATGDILNTESPMSKTLYRSRQSACTAQAGLCYYCSCAMWVRSIDELTQPYGITEKQAKRLQCTAEHLIPRSEGGSDTPSNIVAACRYCNCMRHKRRNPASPAKHLSLVQSRIAKGKWHPEEVVKATWLQSPSSAVTNLAQSSET